MRCLFLTNNPNVCSTSRILQSWLLLGRENGLRGYVVTQRTGDLVNWLQAHDMPCRVDSMPWPDRWKPWRSAWHGCRLARWALRNRIAIVHCNEHDVYPFGKWVARFARLPVVCHIRCKVDAGFSDWAFGRHPPDALIWCTNAMRDECGPTVTRTVTPGRQHVIPLGIDLDAFGHHQSAREACRDQWGIVGDAVVVGMASAIRPGKGIPEFVQIATRWRHRADVVFVLAGGPARGDEAYFDQTRPLVERAVQAGLVRWLGHLEPIEPFLQAIDVFLSTSEHESFGMSVCEAMACRKPVAAYAACSVQDVVGDAGLIVATGHLDALTAAVGQLVDDQQLRQRLGDQARLRVARLFNPAQSLQQLKQLYASLAKHDS